MANFDDQVMGLTGLTISGSSATPSQAELSTFLNDGVNDVTVKTIASRPQDAIEFQRESATIDTNSGLDVGGAQIISVMREANADGAADGTSVWRPCRQILASMQSRVTDTTSLHFASIYNPVYIIDDNGTVNVYPVASANNGYRVFFVNNAPEEADGTALIHSSSDIKYFPKDKVYLVVIYAAIKTLEAKMAEFAIVDEDVELVQAISVNLSALKQQYDAVFASMAPKPTQPQSPQTQQPQGA